MNLIKKLFLLFIALGFFAALFSLAKTINPEPVSADACTLIFSSVGDPIVGQSITATMQNTQPGGLYSVALRRAGFGYVDSQSKTATGNTLSFTIDGSKITATGDYQFESFRTDVYTDCDDPPQFTVKISPPGPKPPPCTLTVDTAFVEGKDVYFGLSNLLSGTTYTVVLYVINENEWGSEGPKITRFSQTFTGPGDVAGSFPGSAIVDFSGISYKIGAYEGTEESGLICVKERPKLAPGHNPCDEDEDGKVEPGEKCKTAIGDFTPELGAFAQKILTIGVSLAGAIALIIMVIGAIRVLTSSGDPKNVAAGREMIIAAIAGLLFLIFSVLILKFIGVSIVGL